MNNNCYLFFSSTRGDIIAFGKTPQDAYLSLTKEMNDKQEFIDEPSNNHKLISNEGWNQMIEKYGKSPIWRQFQQKDYTQIFDSIIDGKTQLDLLTTALEGGSNYWYKIRTEIPKITEFKTPENLNDKGFQDCFANQMWEFAHNGNNIEIEDAENEGEKIGDFNVKNIARGNALLLTKSKDVLSNIIAENWDAGDADVWFQLVVLGDIVYG